jgi:hypothetical protein
MKQKPIEKFNNAEEARDFAVQWQQWQRSQALSWTEVSEWGHYFEELAKKFNLTEEFRENGII